MICIAYNCKLNTFFKDMCYRHHISRIKITKYYHKLGDTLLKDNYDLLPNEKKLNNYNEDKLKKLIYDLFNKISKWKKCLYARKEMEKIYYNNDYGHDIFMKNIKNNIIFIEKYLLKCYSFLIKKDNKLLDIIDKSYKNEIKPRKNKNKKNKRNLKIDKNKSENYGYLDNIEIIKKYDLNNSLKITNIINKIYCLNFVFKNLFTDDLEDDTVLILNNPSYCVFIKEIFNKCETKYINISYNRKNKDIEFQLNYLLDEFDFQYEISKIQLFHDEIKNWIKKIIKIIVNVKYNCQKIYDSFIKYIDNNKKGNDCECEDCICYFDNIDQFIQNYYNILCIHIEKGDVKNICLEKRHKRVLKKELLNIEDILNEIDVINKSLLIPNNFEESICFWILNNLVYDNNIKISKIKEYIISCIENKIFLLCPCIKINNYICYNILRDILLYGCNIYLIKNNIKHDILENINFDFDKEINFYLYNGYFEIENKKTGIDNIILHNNCIIPK